MGVDHFQVPTEPTADLEHPAGQLTSCDVVLVAVLGENLVEPLGQVQESATLLLTQHETKVFGFGPNQGSVVGERHVFHIDAVDGQVGVTGNFVA